MRFLSKLLPAAFLALVAMASGRGLLIYKPSAAHPDGAASVMEYESYRQQGVIARYQPVNGQVFTPAPDSVQIRIEYLDFSSAVLADPSQLKAIEKTVVSYSAYSQQYPASKKPLDPKAEEANEMMRRVKAGEIWMKGQWITKSSYEQMVQKDREDEEAILTRIAVGF